MREIVDRLFDPWQVGLLVAGIHTAPVGIVPAQQCVEPDRLAQIDVNLAESTAQRRQGLQEPQYAFLLLGLTRQLANVGSALDDPLVAEIHGYEYDRPQRIAQVAAQRHRQHARARRKQPPRAAAATLDEILER